MKKILLTFALFWVSVIWAEEGIPSHVELVTGAKQDAQFLGVKDDTVSLGGTIQGQFTVIRIHKNRFKSIVDDNGNDLLNQPQEAPSQASVQDSVAQDSTRQDSTVQDSTQNDSAVGLREVHCDARRSGLDGVGGDVCDYVRKCCMHVGIIPKIVARGSWIVVRGLDHESRIMV